MKIKKHIAVLAVTTICFMTIQTLLTMTEAISKVEGALLYLLVYMCVYWLFKE